MESPRKINSAKLAGVLLNSRSICYEGLRPPQREILFDECEAREASYTEANCASVLRCGCVDHRREGLLVGLAVVRFQRGDVFTLADLVRRGEVDGSHPLNVLVAVVTLDRILKQVAEGDWQALRGSERRSTSWTRSSLFPSVGCSRPWLSRAAVSFTRRRRVRAKHA